MTRHIFLLFLSGPVCQAGLSSQVTEKVYQHAFPDYEQWKNFIRPENFFRFSGKPSFLLQTGSREKKAVSRKNRTARGTRETWPVISGIKSPKKRFLPCIGFLTRPAPDPPRPSEGPPRSFFIFPGRLSSVRESRKTDRRRTEKKLLYPAYFCMLFIQVSGKCLNAGQKNAARHERPGTFPVPSGQNSPQGNGTQFALY